MRSGFRVFDALSFGLASFFLVSSVSSSRLLCEEPLLPFSVRSKFERFAKELARHGRESDLFEMLTRLEEVGHPPRSLDNLRKACAKEAKKAARRPSNRPFSTKQLTKGIEEVSKLLGPLEGSRRTELAQWVLRLDSSQEQARRALGHVEFDGDWVTPEEEKILRGRKKIQATLLAARRLEVNLEVDRSFLPWLKKVGWRTPLVVRGHGLTLHFGIGESRARRIATEILRAVAFSQALRGGKLEIPEKVTPTPFEVVVALSKRDYLDLIDVVRGLNQIDADRVEYVRNVVGAFRMKNGIRINHKVSEAVLCASILNRLHRHGELRGYEHRVQPCLGGPHLNWVSLAYFGSRVPGIRWRETVEVEVDPGAEKYGGQLSAEEIEKEEMIYLSHAGMQGARSWMTYLVGRREDPGWVRSMVSQLKDLSGEDFLKSTMIVEYLQERGDFARILEATTLRDDDENPQKRLEEGLETELEEFEEEWRNWLMPKSLALLQRLVGRKSGSETEAEEMLDHLNRIRKAGWSEDFGDCFPVKRDAGLSRGALLHARYLTLHPGQAEKWPDAHEEWADQEGFTAEGSWAGLHSVIVPGVRAATEAIDEWMSTFYHRLPLLEPGLVRVGWGLYKGTAVLDSSSMVVEGLGKGRVLWPYDGMVDVPLSFRSELPNPVPGEDQGSWGYPITVQTFGTNPKLELKLHEESEERLPLECFYSTPDRPTNITLVPSNAYCLIPKERLKPRTTYVVTGKFDEGEAFSWSFRTGARQ